ncbi:MAG TPA: trypsin-like peptidase domain-containing protein [Chitinophagaceae bacterium]|nr:trypsin-like peptidase domain-containing protein [Chitinophagaceae bacterium]
MGLGSDILEFFHRDRIGNTTTPITLGQLIDSKITNGIIAIDILHAINKLALESYIVPTGTSWNFNIRDNTYQTMIYDKADAEYGVYDFIIYGYTTIYEKFKVSVKPIINLAANGDTHIGTGFLVDFNGNKCLITARHCIEVSGSVLIYDTVGNSAIPTNIYLPEKSDFIGDPGFEFQNIDICVLTFDDTFYTDQYLFRFAEPVILSDVLVLGYPPTGLFDSGADVNNAVLISERASIAHNYVKATTGQNVGTGMLPSTKLDYFLVSARVKGGNSGGPVIDKHGKVVGMITQIPMDGGSSTSDRIDEMGFGFACPSTSIFKFLNSIFSQSNEISFISKVPKVTESGFCID